MLTEGPAIGDGRDIGYPLPWPGTWGGTIGQDSPVRGEAKYSATESDGHLDGAGEPYVTLGVTTDLR